MSKKFFSFLLALTTTLSITACGVGNNAGGVNNAANGNNEVNSANNQLNDQGGLPEASLENNDINTAGSQSNDQDSAPETFTENDNANVVDSLGGKLANAYIEMLSERDYYMKYRAQTEFENEKMGAVLEFAVKNGKTAMISDVEGTSMHMIEKQDGMYLVNHDQKTIMVMPSSPMQVEGNMLPYSGFVYKGSGISELFGVPRPYEEYGTDSGDIKFFFDGSKLAGFEILVEGLTMQMEILEMSKNIPSGMFDVPDGYEKISFDDMLSVG